MSLSVEDRDEIAVFNHSLIILGVFCRNDEESLTEKEIQRLNATFRDEFLQKSSSSGERHLDSLRNCFLDESKFVHHKLGETYKVNLQAALGYEIASLYLLVFGVRRDCHKCAVSDIAMVIIKVENVDEPARISDCLDGTGHENPTLFESSAEMQSICNITVSFDDRQDAVECIVSEGNSNRSRFFPPSVIRTTDISNINQPLL